MENIIKENWYINLKTSFRSPLAHIHTCINLNYEKRIKTLRSSSFLNM